MVLLQWSNFNGPFTLLTTTRKATWMLFSSWKNKYGFRELGAYMMLGTGKKRKSTFFHNSITSQKRNQIFYPQELHYLPNKFCSRKKHRKRKVSINKVNDLLHICRFSRVMWFYIFSLLFHINFVFLFIHWEDFFDFQ